MRKTDYTRKCGTCKHFERNGEYRHGWCHRFPYNENVVCDPKHPYPQRAMSATCAYYFDGRQTNADHIRSMTDEELADTFEMREFFAVAYNGTYDERHRPALDWLKQPYKEETK